VVLGAASPYAVRLSVRTVEQSGQITGRLYAISTLGSLAGVFIAALLLIPFAGTRITFLLFALALALVAMLGLGARALVAAGLVAGAMLLPTPEVKAALNGERVVTEQETEYGFARVVESRSGERRLELNEGVAVHSILRSDRAPTVGGYWAELSVLPWAVERPGGSGPKRIAILGNAAGTIARSLTMLHPDLKVDGVEIDGRLTDIGRRWFDLRPSPNLRVYTADARPFMRRSLDHYDAVLLDAYRQPYVPFHVATKEFFALVKGRLAPGGVLVVNVGHPAGNDALEQALSATLKSVFTHVKRDPAQDLNTQLIASDSPVTGRALARAAATLPPALSQTALNAGQRIAPALEGGDVWTDDRAPVEWLIDGSIVKEATKR
jgi:spermidine synthase